MSFKKFQVTDDRTGEVLIDSNSEIETLDFCNCKVMESQYPVALWQDNIPILKDSKNLDIIE